MGDTHLKRTTYHQPDQYEIRQQDYQREDHQRTQDRYEQQYPHDKENSRSRSPLRYKTYEGA